jgi:hypothetical protein
MDKLVFLKGVDRLYNKIEFKEKVNKEDRIETYHYIIELMNMESKGAYENIIKSLDNGLNINFILLSAIDDYYIPNKNLLKKKLLKYKEEDEYYDYLF